MINSLQNKIMSLIQAKFCESSNHWAMAAILWRRGGEEKKAESCETILYNLVMNANFKLEQRKPIIVFPRGTT